MPKRLKDSTAASAADINATTTITINLSETEIQPENWEDQLSEASNVHLQCVLSGPITEAFGGLLVLLTEFEAIHGTQLDLHAVELDFTNSSCEMAMSETERVSFPFDAITALPCESLTIRGLKQCETQDFDVEFCNGDFAQNVLTQLRCMIHASKLAVFDFQYLEHSREGMAKLPHLYIPVGGSVKQLTTNSLPLLYTDSERALTYGYSSCMNRDLYQLDRVNVRIDESGVEESQIKLIKLLYTNLKEYNVVFICAESINDLLAFDEVVMQPGRNLLGNMALSIAYDLSMFEDNIDPEISKALRTLQATTALRQSLARIKSLVSSSKSEEQLERWFEESRTQALKYIAGLLEAANTGYMRARDTLNKFACLLQNEEGSSECNQKWLGVIVSDETCHRFLLRMATETVLKSDHPALSIAPLHQAAYQTHEVVNDLLALALAGLPEPFSTILSMHGLMKVYESSLEKMDIVCNPNYSGLKMISHRSVEAVYEQLPQLLSEYIAYPADDTTTIETVFEPFIDSAKLIALTHLKYATALLKKRSRHKDQIIDETINMLKVTVELSQLLITNNLLSCEEERCFDKFLAKYLVNSKTKSKDLARELVQELSLRKVMRIGEQIDWKDEALATKNFIRMQQQLICMVACVEPELHYISHLFIEYFERKYGEYAGLCDNSDIMRERIVAVVTKDLESKAEVKEPVSKIESRGGFDPIGANSISMNTALRDTLHKHEFWLQLANSPEISPEAFAFLYAAWKITPRNQDNLVNPLQRNYICIYSTMLKVLSPIALADIILSFRISPTCAKEHVENDRKAVVKTCMDNGEIRLPKLLKTAWSM